MKNSIYNLLVHFRNKRIIRYAFGGGCAALIDLVCLYIFTDIVGIWYLYSQVLAFCISFLFGFWFQKHITFQKKDGNRQKQITFFLLFQMLGMAINIGILWVSVEQFGVHYLVGSIIAKGIVFVWNYIMNAQFNFKK